LAAEEGEELAPSPEEVEEEVEDLYLEVLDVRHQGSKMMVKKSLLASEE